MWVKEKLGDSIGLSISSRYRARSTNSDYEWVDNLKSFKQFQHWIKLEWISYMIDTKNKILIAGLILIFGSCIEPVSDDLWSVMIEKECGTSGYARDVHVENDIAYVAAGEGGAEIWDLSSGSGPTLLNAISLDDIGARKEISKNTLFINQQFVAPA